MKDVDPLRRKVSRWGKTNWRSRKDPVARPESDAMVAPLIEALRADDLLERCFRELTRFYRHSGVGQRCHGIVHRMNTPLQVLSFQVELLEQKSREELQYVPACPLPAAERLQVLHDYRVKKIHQVRLELEKLQSAAHTIIQQGVHEESAERLYLDLNQIYAQELDLYQAVPFFQHQVEKEVRLDPHVPPLHGYYIDFSQSFRNLVDNALEAMTGEERRQLTVETGMEDGMRVLCIGDTGPGIPPEVLPRIFDPFFTTKGTPVMPRAGLGLFMTRRLLAPYGAAIQVDSVPGETWVTVRLPV